MTDPRRPDEDDDPAPEDPTRFRDGEIAPLDEAPGGRTPSDPNERDEGSLPPGA